MHRRDVLHEVMDWDKRYARMTIRKKEMNKKIQSVAEELASARITRIWTRWRRRRQVRRRRLDEALDDVEAKLSLRFDEQLTAIAERDAARGKNGAAAALRPLNRTQYAYHCKKGSHLLPLYGATPRDSRQDSPPTGRREPQRRRCRT